MVRPTRAIEAETVSSTLRYDHDIRALNELQFLVAEKNLYFSPSQDYTAFADQIEEVSAEREIAVPGTQVFIPVEGSKGADRSAKPGEEMTAKQMLLATSFRYPTPSSWPSKLRIREKVKTFEKGSSVGHVQKSDLLTSRGRTTYSPSPPFGFHRIYPEI